MASETGNIAHPGGQKFFREPNPLKHIQPIDSTIISASSHSWGPQRSTCRNAVCTSRTSCDMMCHPRTGRKKRIHLENVACELRPQTLPKPGWPAPFLGVGRREAFAGHKRPLKIGANRLAVAAFPNKVACRGQHWAPPRRQEGRATPLAVRHPEGIIQSTYSLPGS